MSRSIDDRISTFFEAHYRTELQRKELEAVRDLENVVLRDEDIERIASLHPAAFGRSLDEVRTHYARRERVDRRVSDGGSFAPGSIQSRAVAIATRDGCGYAEGLTKARGGI